jgi:UDP-galactopyranose mutase
MSKFDFLIVGSGLFGSIFARECANHNKTVLVIEKRDHIGGNCYTDSIHGVQVHKYGPHIFHTNSKKIWDYINQYTRFNNFIYSPLAKYKDKFYSLPFNMWTFHQIWGVHTPNEAKKIIESHKYHGPIKNLEDQAKSMVGYEIYEKLIKHYTTKQWNRNPRDLPSFIINRLPIRYTYNNNYFNDIYQGIPIDGYTEIFKNLLDGIYVELNCDYFNNRSYYNSLAKNVIYTGQIDKFCDYVYGKLEYRSLRFENSIHKQNNIQGVAVINHTSDDVDYTRTIEHKHFNYIDTKYSVLTKEYPENFNESNEPYYPVNIDINNDKWLKYYKLVDKQKIILGGRLAEYKYYNMDQVIARALTLVSKVLQRL